MLTFLEETEELYRETNKAENMNDDSRGHFQFSTSHLAKIPVILFGRSLCRFCS